ncbi:MAG: DUF1963 domain-containing protein [Lachnospira sp.]|nr:DUF1963 domain-containing protein [Lachnospira sp.]
MSEQIDNEELEKFKEMMRQHNLLREARKRVDFADFVKEAGNMEGYEALAESAKNVIPIIETAMEDGEIPVGASKMGGYPDLPPSIPYPVMEEFTEEKKEWVEVRPGVRKCQPTGFITYPKSAMQLLGQFNLAEVAPFDKDNLLPKTGMLYFFWSGELPYFAKEVTPVKVIYWDGDMSELRRTVPDEPYYEKYFTQALPSKKFTFEYCKNEYDVNEIEEELGEQYDYYSDYNVYGAKLFGYPEGVNIDCPRGDMINLFQSSYSEGCISGIYWYISKQDLANRNFDSVVFVEDLD